MIIARALMFFLVAIIAVYTTMYSGNAHAVVKGMYGVWAYDQSIPGYPGTLWHKGMAPKPVAVLRVNRSSSNCSILNIIFSYIPTQPINPVTFQPGIFIGTMQVDGNAPINISVNASSSGQVISCQVVEKESSELISQMKNGNTLFIKFIAGIIKLSDTFKIEGFGDAIGEVNLDCITYSKQRGNGQGAPQGQKKKIKEDKDYFK